MGLFDDLPSDRALATRREFSVGDVQASMRGDMFNEPNLPIKYAAQPGQRFGEDATANAQPFQNIVAHHTGSSTLGSALNTARGGPLGAGPRFGYHFYIDKDGSVTQGAPLDARTNHVKAPGRAERTNRPDIGNENSVGISFVGSGEEPTPAQLSAAQNLSKSLMGRYDIPQSNVVGHGEIQSDRRSGEGMPLVNAIRQDQPQIAQAPVRVAASTQTMSDAPQPGFSGSAMAAERPQFVAQRPDSRADQPFVPQRPDSLADRPQSTGLFDDIPTQKKDIGRGRALAEGVRSGVTMNFGDELAGVAAAGGTPEDLRSPLSGPSDAVIGLAKLGYQYMTGGDEAAKRYAARRDEVRADQKAAEEQYPGTYIAGQVGGAVALPVGGMLSAPTMAGRMGRGAVMGAATGGASGVGEGTTVEDRATRGAIGLVGGGVFGATGVPVIEGAVKGIGAVVSKPVNMLRSAINPTGGAERAIGRAYRDAVETDPNALNRLAQSELQPGGPQTVLDTLGAPGRDLARSAANLSGGARDKLNQTLDERFESQGSRITDWFRSTFNYPNAHGQQQAIDQLEKTVNRQAYGKAYRDGDRGVWSPELERLTGSPDVVSAMSDAATKGKSRAIVDGMGGFNPGVTFENGLLKFQRGQNGVPSYPTLQFWDYTRRNISDAAKAAARAGREDEADYLGKLAKGLNTELDKLVPSYQQARAGAASFFGAENALEAGQKFVTENFAIPQTRGAIARMSQTERQLFQDGFVSRFVEMVEKVPDRADVVRKIYNSPAAKEKIRMVLGPQRSAELEATLRVEGIMQQGLRAVQGNSTTTQQILAAGLAGGAGGGWLGFDPSMSGAAGALAIAGKRGIDHRVANKVAEMLASTDPAVLSRGIKMVAGNQRMMGALRSADAAAARAGGGQAQALPAPMLQLPAPSRAEDEQPNVPRIPSQ